MAYSAAVFQNCGNYRAFGDTKFVPELPSEEFKTVLDKSEAHKSHAQIIDEIWTSIEKEVYAEEDPFRSIGFRDENGTTSYYSSNITSADAKLIDEFCQVNKISPLNTRLFKISDTEYELRIASSSSDASKTPYLKTYEHTGGIKVHVTAADFTEIMAKVVKSLEQGLEYVGNENQEKMITDYIEHFRFGEYGKIWLIFHLVSRSIKTHRDTGSRMSALS